jgi:hypothetical protein
LPSGINARQAVYVSIDIINGLDRIVEEVEEKCETNTCGQR